MIVRKSAEEIETMARAGRVVAETLAAIGEAIRPGVTTLELDELAEDLIRSAGGVPTFKGYNGFPGSICASPNSMVVHGIPGPYTVVEGDVMSIDVGVTLDGFVADSARTFGVGEIDAEAQRLLDVCEAALAAGIEAARPGRSHRRHLRRRFSGSTEDAGFSIVRSLVGHGVGRDMHEEPQVPNFGEPGHGPKLVDRDDDRDRADDHRRRRRRLPRRGRLVDLHERRIAVRAFRAHGCDNRRWTAHSHYGRSPR